MAPSSSTFLRRVLLADGALSGVSAPLFVFGAPLLQTFIGLPEAIVRYAGLILIPFAVFVVYLSRRDEISPAAIWSVMAMNVAWVVASVALLVTGSRPLLGSAFIVVQAIAVAAFAEMQYVGLRRAANQSWSPISNT